MKNTLMWIMSMRKLRNLIFILPALSLIVFGLAVERPATGQGPSDIDYDYYLPLVTRNSTTLPNNDTGSATTPTGFDPLLPDEEQNVIEQLLSQGQIDSRSSATQEVLLVERYQEPKKTYQSGTWPRRSEIYIYDYPSDTLRHILFNVETDTIEADEIVQQVQLPLTENELTRAADILWQDAVTKQAIVAQYAALTGEALLSLDQLNIKAFVFHANSMPDDLNEASQQCGLHRCAQMLLYTEDHTAFEITPIVDLSRRYVPQLLDF